MEETNWATVMQDLRQLLKSIETIEGTYSAWDEYPEDSHEAAVFSYLTDADGLIYQAMGMVNDRLTEQEQREIGIPRL